ncbi:MAG TPA: hypothetical protein V6D10_04045 [Trichocoleus sp.]|jgi:gas vesicle protein
MVMTDTELTEAESNIDVSPNNTSSDENISDNGFNKVAIGVLIGATLGGIAGALSTRGVVDRVNRTVRDVGNSVKKAASSVDDTIRQVGDAVHSVTTEVNSTVKDVGDAVKDATEGVSSTVQSTVNSVKSTAADVNSTVQNTVNAVKDTTGEMIPSNEKERNVTEQNTLYKLVPVNSNEAGS